MNEKTNLGSDSGRLFILGLVIYFLLGTAFLWRRTQQTDFVRLWSVAHATRLPSDGGIYSRANIRRIVTRSAELRTDKKSFVAAGMRRILVAYPGGTPFLFASLRLLSSGSYRLDYQLFRHSSLAIFAIGLVLFLRQTGVPWPRVLAGCVIVTAFFWPFRLDTAVGNFNQIEVGLLCLALVLVSTNDEWPVFTAGAVIAVVAGLRPALSLIGLLIAIELVARRQFSTAKWFGLGFAAFTALVLIAPSTMLGASSSWVPWFRILRLARRVPAYGRSSLLSQLSGFHQLAYFRLAMMLGIIAVTVRAYVTASREIAPLSQERALERLAHLSGLGAGVFLLTSPIAFADNTLLLLPALAVLITQDGGGRWQRTLAWVALAFLAAHPVLRVLRLSVHPFQDPLTLAGCVIPVALSFIALGDQENAPQ